MDVEKENLFCGEESHNIVSKENWTLGTFLRECARITGEDDLRIDHEMLNVKKKKKGMKFQSYLQSIHPSKIIFLRSKKKMYVFQVKYKNVVLIDKMKLKHLGDEAEVWKEKFTVKSKGLSRASSQRNDFLKKYKAAEKNLKVSETKLKESAKSRYVLNSNFVKYKSRTEKYKARTDKKIKDLERIIRVLAAKDEDAREY